jgi:hypothetical protein
MNDSLNRWLTNRGFTGNLADKTKQYLMTVVPGSTGSETVNDLWVSWAALNGLGGAEMQRIQRSWAILQGSNGSQTWNDAMSTLPP